MYGVYVFLSFCSAECVPAFVSGSPGTGCPLFVVGHCRIPCHVCHVLLGVLKKRMNGFGRCFGDRHCKMVLLSCFGLCFGGRHCSMAL